MVIIGILAFRGASQEGILAHMRQLARYQVNLVPPGEDEGFADGVAAVYFNDLEALLRITASQQVKTVQQDSVVHSAAINRLLVQEHPIV